MHLKPHLPQKICPVCQRPFAWRRKVARCWSGCATAANAAAVRRSTPDGAAPHSRGSTERRSQLVSYAGSQGLLPDGGAAPGDGLLPPPSPEGARLLCRHARLLRRPPSQAGHRVCYLTLDERPWPDLPSLLTAQLEAHQAERFAWQSPDEWRLASQLYPVGCWPRHPGPRGGQRAFF